MSKSKAIQASAQSKRVQPKKPKQDGKKRLIERLIASRQITATSNSCDSCGENCSD